MLSILQDKKCDIRLDVRPLRNGTIIEHCNLDCDPVQRVSQDFAIPSCMHPRASGNFQHKDALSRRNSRWWALECRQRQDEQ